MRQPRRPRIVSFKLQTIRMICRRKTVTVKRWQVVLDFGGKREKLAVSANVVRWLKGQRKKGTP